MALYRRATRLRPDWDEGAWYIGSLLYEREALRRSPRRVRDAGRAHSRRTPAPSACAACASSSSGPARGGAAHACCGRVSSASRTRRASRSVVRYHAGILLTRFGEFEVASSVLSEPGRDIVESPAHDRRVRPEPAADADAALRECRATRRALVQLGRAARRSRWPRAGRRRPSGARRARHRDYPKSRTCTMRAASFNLSATPDAAIADFEPRSQVDSSHLLAHLQLALEWLRRGERRRRRGAYAEARRGRSTRRSAAARVGAGPGPARSRATSTGAIAELETAVRPAPAARRRTSCWRAPTPARARTADAERERREFTRLDRASKPR